MKRTVFLLAAAMLLLLTTAAFASQTDLEQLARQYVPQDAVFERTERDDGLQEYEFRSPDRSVTYDVKINPDTGLVVKVDYDVRNDRGSKNVILTEAQAGEKVLELYPGAEITNVLLQRDDGLQEYAVLFTAADFTGKIELNPETGAVLDRELDYTRSGESASGPLTAEEAKAFVLAKVEDGRIVDFETDRDDGRTVYEGEVVSGKTQYDFEIDAETGALLKWEIDD
ncbi:MAG: hypothetical protein E7335_04365 [Clostridiales bacterium]|nr:hypothetical protein [Clostridiales bacterium]